MEFYELKELLCVCVCAHVCVCVCVCVCPTSKVPNHKEVFSVDKIILLSAKFFHYVVITFKMDLYETT